MSGALRGPTGAAEYPPDLTNVALPLSYWRAGSCFLRIHRCDLHPIFFSPGPDTRPTGRFDSATGAFGVLYGAESFAGAFAETVLRNPARTIFGLGEIEAKCVSRLRLRAGGHLVDLRGAGLQRLGLDAAIFTGPYEPCGAWADALFAHTASPTGILYPSRFDPAETCLALFERPDGIEIAENPIKLSSLAADVGALLRRYGKGLDVEQPIPRG